MNKNVGGSDRIVRIFIGLALFSLFFVLEGPWRFVSLMGIIPLYTALTQSCLINRLLGRNTCPLK
jgi:hypothetical protein